MRRINTLLRGASQKVQGGGMSLPPGGEEGTLHVVDMFGFENCEVRKEGRRRERGGRRG